MAVNFDFSKYDVGGMNAIPGDGKLTGEEVEKAKKDGWNIWDGYNKDDKTPTNPKLEAEEKVKQAEKDKDKFDLKKYDIGGNNAIAADGQLTGEEVERAKAAGFNVYEGYNGEYGEPSKCTEYGTVMLGLTRIAAQKSESKIVRNMATFVDMCLLPLEFSIGFIQHIARDE